MMVRLNIKKPVTPDEVYADWAQSEGLSKESLLQRREPIIKWFPSDTAWYLTELTSAQFFELYLIKSSPWDILSDNTWLLSKSADNVYSREFETHQNKEVQEAMQKIRRIASSPPFRIREFKPIMLGKAPTNNADIERPATIVDGCHRSNVLYKKLSSKEIETQKIESYIGLSPIMGGCKWY